MKLFDDSGLKTVTMKTMFSLFNRIYRRLIRIAINKGYVEALLEAPSEFLPEQVVFDREKLPHNLGCSFHTEISTHSRSWYGQRDRKDLPEWSLDNKLDAYRFAKKLGVRTPKTFQRGARFSTLEFLPNTVLKPEEAFQSLGVFILNKNCQVTEVATNTPNLTKDQVLLRMNNLLSKRKVLKDLWCSEEFISDHNGNPAADIKFYCFYGKCAMVLKRQLIPEVGLTFQCLDRSGKIIQSKAHPGSDLSHIHVNEEDFRLAENFSAKLPTPFMRLDFLRGKELVFSEIGNLVGHFGGFGTQIDRLMGLSFVDARSRLHDDLRSGATFEEYDAFIRESRASSRQHTSEVITNN